MQERNQALHASALSWLIFYLKKFQEKHVLAQHSPLKNPNLIDISSFFINPLLLVMLCDMRHEDALARTRSAIACLLGCLYCVKIKQLDRAHGVKHWKASDLFRDR